MAALDAAVGQAMEMLDPKTTLLLVTGDHETGGLAVNGYPDEKDGIWSMYRRLTGDEPYPVVTFASGPGLRNGSRPAPHGPDDRRPSGIPLRSGAHTAVDVPLYAWGAGSDGIHGTIENTAIYSILRSTLEGRDPVLRPADARRGSARARPRREPSAPAAPFREMGASGRRSCEISVPRRKDRGLR